MMTYEQAMNGSQAPADVQASMVLVSVPYIDFNGEHQVGQLLVDREVAEEVKTIFQTIRDAAFPVERMIPIVAYDWDDFTSIKANNSSAFNYRLILGTDKLSNHSFGRAIDINPVQNPYVGRDGESQPPGYVYDPEAKGTLVDGDIVVHTFLKYGWSWGGHWNDPKDYQHFEKPKTAS